MEREIKNVAIYVRKSREEETDDALKRQKAVLIELCEKNKWEYDVYFETGSSQQIDNPELQKMLSKIELFNYDGVVIADLDRLSRNLVNSGVIKEKFINAGCLAITPSKIYDYTKQDDDLFSDLQFVLAKNEYQTIKRRLMRGVRQSAKDGNWLGKRNPVGYKYNRETKRLEKTDDAPIIRRIFEEYINGLSTKDIAFNFTNENVTTSVGMIWTPAGISRLLGNPVYVGHSLYGKTTSKNGKRSIKTSKEDQILVENTHESIVNQEEWETVQRIKRDRNSKPIALGANKHKFSGLIKCSLCGAIHSFQTSRYKRKRISSCQTRLYSNNNNYSICENKGMNISDFEILFYAEFEEHIEEIKSYREYIEKNKKQNTETINTSSLEKQIKRVQQDINRVQQGFIAQIFTEEQASKQIKKYNIQIETLTKKIEEINASNLHSELDYVESVINKMTMFLSGDDILTEKESNQILKQLIKEILYKRNDELAEVVVVWKHRFIKGDINE